MNEQKWIGEDGPQEIWVFLDQGTNVTGYSETGPELARPNERAVHFTRAPQWQPIETAPKDGTFFLAVVKGFAPAVAQWTTDFRPEGEFTFLEPGMFADESHWDEMLAQTDPWQPTHWQPLPDAPEVI